MIDLITTARAVFFHPPGFIWHCEPALGAPRKLTKGCEKPSELGNLVVVTAETAPLIFQKPEVPERPKTKGKKLRPVSWAAPFFLGGDGDAPSWRVGKKPGWPMTDLRIISWTPITWTIGHLVNHHTPSFKITT